MNRTYLGEGPFCLCVLRSQYIASSISLLGIKRHIEVLWEVFYKDFVTTFIITVAPCAYMHVLTACDIATFITAQLRRMFIQSKTGPEIYG